MIGAPQQFGGSSPMTRLNAAIKGQPRNALILGLLVVVLVGMWVKLIMGSSASPATASASSSSPLPTTALPPPDMQVSGSGPRNAAPRSMAEWIMTRTGPVKRNLFAVPFDAYPQDPEHPAPTSRPSGKSGPSEADQERERQALYKQVQAQASRLKLEGIVLGASPRVWVNGTLVGVGQSIGETGLTVVRIEARRVVVERNGVQVEITLK